MGSNVSPEHGADKTEVVAARVSPREKKLIAIAAAHSEVKVSEFVAKAALDAALVVVELEHGKPLTEPAA